MTRESQYHMPYGNYAQKDCKLISSIFHFFHPKTVQGEVKVAAALPMFSPF